MASGLLFHIPRSLPVVVEERSDQTRRLIMSYCRISKGSLVDVHPENTPGKRYGEGEAFVEKKRHKKTNESGQEIPLTQETGATELSGQSVLQVKYTLDNQKSPAIKKDRFSIAHFETTA